MHLAERRMSETERIMEVASDEGCDDRPVGTRTNPSGVTTEAQIREGAATMKTTGVDLRFTVIVEGDSSFQFSQAMTHMGG